MKTFEEYHAAELRDLELKLRNKAHAYIVECLSEIEGDLRDQYRFTFA